MGEKVLANAETLLGIKMVRRHKAITLPVSGHNVRIQSITELELGLYQKASMARKGTGNQYNPNRLLDASRRFIVLCLVDAAGNRLLQDSQARDLANWDAADTQFLYDECADHCGLDKQGIEELVGNSAEVHADGPPSDSQSE